MFEPTETRIVVPGADEAEVRRTVQEFLEQHPEYDLRAGEEVSVGMKLSGYRDTPDAVSDAGPDLVYRDPETGEVVVSEAKFLSADGNFNKGNLGKTKNKEATQMSDEWVENVAEEGRGVSSATADEISTAQMSGNLRKELTVIQNTPVEGKTISESISSDVGIDSVTLHKIGQQRPPG